MLEFDTFLTLLYVKADDFCKSQSTPKAPGPAPALSRSEVVTLAVVAQWQRWPSERAFYRFAINHLRTAFPDLPDRSQFNRQLRQQREVIVEFWQDLTSALTPRPKPAYEAMDTMAVATRNVKRRGYGHLAGLTSLGYSNRLGWFHGFRLLLSVQPSGVVSGYGFGSGNSKDQPLASTFVALRQQSQPAISSVGTARPTYYIVDQGFTGRKLRQEAQHFGAEVVGVEQGQTKLWTKAWRRWLAGMRQIVETVNAALLERFSLERERPHQLEGFQARLAAKVALHNFCIWLNRRLGRADLAFADLLNW